MHILVQQPTNAKAPQRKLRPVLQVGIGLFLIAVVVAMGLYLTGDSFREKVRLRLIEELELITGGRVELGSLRWNLSRLQFEATNLTVHGLEGPGEAPYAHVDRLTMRAKILSLLQRKVGLRSLTLEHPVIHIITYPDGRTNQPTPKSRTQSGRAPLEELFALRMNSLQVTRGLLVWNDRKLPFDFAADDVTAQMSYRRGVYAAKVALGKLHVNYDGIAGLLTQAESEINLRPDAVEVRSLHWSTAKSRVDLSGRVTDFKNPKLEASYQATLDLGEAAKLAKVKSVPGGSAQINGTGRFLSLKEYSSTGKLELRNASWATGSARIPALDATADFAIDPEKVGFSHLVARALGGTASGDATVSHWANAAPAKPARQGSARLNISGIEVAQALEAIAPGQRAVRIRIASRASGKVDLRWTGSPVNSEAEAALELAAPQQTQRPELPVQGTIKASYSAPKEQIEVRQLNLAAPKTRLDAVGTLGATANPDAALKINLNTTDLSELEPVLRVGDGLLSLPVDVRGRASFSGVVTGKLNAPDLNGHLLVSDFDTLVPASVEAWNGGGDRSLSAGLQRIHWDSLAADVSYSSTSARIRNAVLKHGPTQILGAASAGLVKGRLTDQSSVTLQAKMTNADLRDLQALTGAEYPLTGVITGQMSVRGTQRDLHGVGSVQIKDGELYGVPYRSLQTHLNVQGQELQATNLSFDLSGAGTVIGSAGYNLQSKAFGINLRGRNVDLAQLAKLSSRNIPVSGNGEFTLNGSGTLDEPTVNADVLLHGVKIAQQAAGDITLSAVTRGDNLHLAGRSSLQNSALSLDGDVNLRADFPGEIKILVAGLDVSPLVRNATGAQYPLHTSVSGTVQVTGPFKQPRRLTAVAEFPEATGAIENVTLRNEGPLRLVVRDQVVRLEQFHVVGTGTDLTASGTMDFSGAQPIAIRGNGQVNLKLLESFDPNVVSEGMTEFVLDARGTLKRPDLNGKIDIHNGSLSLVDAPNGLSNINGTLAFEQDRVRVQQLTAVTGGGTLNLGGFVTYNNGLYFDITASGRDVRVRYPEGTSSQGNADLRFAGTSKNALLSGDALITHFGITPHFDLGLWLARIKKPPTAPDPNSVIDNVRLDVHVTSTPELQVETSLAKLAGDVDLRLKGTVARPSILGRVNIAEGDIYFNNTKYHLERGDILFVNPAKIDPVLNVEASTHVSDYDITLGFHGTPEKLSTTYRSDPPLPSSDIIQLLAFGQTRAASQQQVGSASSAETVSSASNAILGSALNAVVGSRVQRLFGISKVKIDPTANNADNPNARLITIEQQISNRVTVTYSTNFTQAQQQVISIEYNINPNVSLLAVRDQYGVFGLDVRIRQRKR